MKNCVSRYRTQNGDFQLIDLTLFIPTIREFRMIGVTQIHMDCAIRVSK